MNKWEKKEITTASHNGSPKSRFETSNLTIYPSGRRRERTDAADLIYGALLDIIRPGILLLNRK